METTLQDRKLDLVLDVKVQLTARLGRCHLPMREVLELSLGAIIQLDARANDPVGLYVNEKLIARGEVVVLDENFGIKITELVGEKK
jgi:flagellar motor switch protein FliN